MKMIAFSSRTTRCRRAVTAPLLLACLGVLLPASVRAYVLEGPKWQNNTSIVMYLQLGTSSSAFIDGLSSWDDEANTALAIWNPYLGSGVQFRIATTATANAAGDRHNSVFFSSTVFGTAFGSDTLAITQSYYNASGTPYYTEADVVVNTAKPYNAYRGNLRSGTFDIRRVLLHEFGHVLGLDHVSQSTAAIMVPATNNLDTIQADDINGVAALYGGGTSTVSAPAITSTLTASAQLGQAFSYQITASNAPTGFAAGSVYSSAGGVTQPLPAGLSLNAATGLISGTPTREGDYVIAVQATNSGGSDLKQVRLIVSLTTGVIHPTFFVGEQPLSNGVYYLKFFYYGQPANYFGYYSYLSDPRYIYNFDLGYEYVFDAFDGRNGVYFYDFKSNGFFYSSPAFPFPYLYDFTLNSTVYYYGNPADSTRYNTNGVRYFYVFRTGQIISK